MRQLRSPPHFHSQTFVSESFQSEIEMLRIGHITNNFILNLPYAQSSKSKAGSVSGAVMRSIFHLRKQDLRMVSFQFKENQNKVNSKLFQ